MRILRTLVVIVVLLSTGAWLHAQATKSPGAQVLSGSDIGFRIERQNGETPIGKLVIRVDGKWVEPQFSAGIKQLTK